MLSLFPPFPDLYGRIQKIFTGILCPDIVLHVPFQFTNLAKSRGWLWTLAPPPPPLCIKASTSLDFQLPRPLGTNKYCPVPNCIVYFIKTKIGKADTTCIFHVFWYLPTTQCKIYRPVPSLTVVLLQVVRTVPLRSHANNV